MKRPTKPADDSVLEAQLEPSVRDGIAEKILAEFRSAIEENMDPKYAYKFISLLESLQLIDPELYQIIAGSEDVPSLRQRGREIIEKWRSEINEGDYVEYFSANDGGWFGAKVLSREGDMVLLHYLGWADKFNRNIPVEEVVPYTCRTKIHPSARKSLGLLAKEKNTTAGRSSSSSSSSSSSAGSDPAPEDIITKKEGMVLSRSGRWVKAVAPPQPGIKRSRGRASDAGDGDGGGDGDEDGENKKKEPKLYGGREINEDHNDWLCGTCGLLEAKDGTDLILCDGPCLASFHLGCLDATSRKRQQEIGDSDKPWLCKNCFECKHLCFICGKRGKDHIEVAKCSTKLCGKYYHRYCLENHVDDQDHQTPLVQPCKVTVSVPVGWSKTPGSPTGKKKGRPKKENRVDTDEGAESGAEEASAPTSEQKKSVTPQATPSSSSNGHINGHSHNSDTEMEVIEVDSFKFNCPCHSCHACCALVSGKVVYLGGNKLDNRPLFRCIRCPKAYHVNCIPPWARYNTLCVLCDRHPDEILPSKEYVDKKVHAYGQLWDGLVLPESPPEVKDASAHHFRLPVSFQQEVRNKPPEFKSINKLDYDCLPLKEKSVPRVTPDEMCTCVEECGERCLNRLSKIECFESNVPKEDNICPIGPGCGNRCLQERKYAKTERFQEWAMGWGLRAKEFIPEGTLVIEYLGEVIDEQQMQTRMQNQRKYTPNDPNFYIMQLDSGLYVDGKHKGNESRFINHSCDPNCELQPWLVKGRMRIGIFAIRNIDADEPLSYDYQFDTNEDDAFKCYCGTEICRGTMAPKKKDKDKDKMSRGERLALIRAGKKKASRTVAERIELEKSRSYVSKYLPGDSINEIRNGPSRSTFSYARHSNLFLPRNIPPTSNFLKRRKSSWERRKWLDKWLNETGGLKLPQTGDSSTNGSSSSGAVNGNAQELGKKL